MRIFIFVLSIFFSINSFSQASLTAFPLAVGDSTLLAFYTTSGSASNSRLDFVADLSGTNVDIDPADYEYDVSGSTGYSSTGYWFTGSKIFGIPVCYNDTASYTMFILVSSMATDFKVMYYAGTDGQQVGAIDPTGINYGFCGSGESIGGIARIYANNGLTVVGDTLAQLGGTLIKNTNIALDNYIFSIVGNSSNPIFSIGGDEINLSEGNVSGGLTTIQIGNDPSGYLLRNYPPGLEDYYEFGMSTFSNRSTWHFFKDGVGRNSYIDIGDGFMNIRSNTMTILGTTQEPSSITLGQIFQSDPATGGSELNTMIIGARGDTKLTLEFKDTTDAAVSLVGLTADDRVRSVDIDSITSVTNPYGGTNTFQASLDSTKTALTLAVSNDSLSINGGNTVVLPSIGQYQFSVDDYGANGTDTLNDDIGFQAAWDAMMTAGGKNLGLSPGATYYIKDIDWGNYGGVLIDFNGATVVCDTTNEQRGSINMVGAQGNTFINGTLKGETLTAYGYNVNHTFIHLHLSKNVRFENMNFVNPYSHAVTALDHVLATGTEKRGIVFSNCIFEDHHLNLANASSDNRYSYVKFEKEAEYNSFNNCKAFYGQSLVRSIGGANDNYNSIIVEDFDHPNFDADSVFQSALIYYDTLLGGSNSGKIQFSNLKFNHNNDIVNVVIKQSKSQSIPRVCKFTNCDFLVNGQDIVLSELIYIENAHGTRFSQCTFRPRQKPGSSTIVLKNARYTTFTDCDIFRSSSGIDAFTLIDSDSVYLQNNNFVVNNLLNGSTLNSSLFYLSDGPTYSRYGDAIVDTTLSEGSQFKVDDNSTSFIKDSESIDPSINLIVDTGTKLSGEAISSGSSMLSIARNDLPNGWNTKYFTMETRFKMSSVLNNNYLFSMTGGSNAYYVQWSSGGIITSYADGIVDVTGTHPIEPNRYFVLKVDYQSDDTLRIYLNDTLTTSFYVDFDQSLNTNSRYFYGRSINAINGFIGEVDYIKWKGKGYFEDILEFGDQDPDIVYTLGASVTKLGNDYVANRFVSEDILFTDSGGGKIKASISAINPYGGTNNFQAALDSAKASITSDQISGTTDASGLFTITNPYNSISINVVLGSVQQADAVMYELLSVTTSTITVRARNVSDGAIRTSDTYFANYIIHKE